MKSFFEEHGGTYTRVGDYLLPDLVMEEQPEGQISKYGRMRLEHLNERKKSLCNDLLLSRKLRQHLLGIDRDAREEFETIARQTVKAGACWKQDRLWLKSLHWIRCVQSSGMPSYP